MLGGAALLSAETLVASFVTSFGSLLPLRFIPEAGYSVAQTPAGCLFRRSAAPEDRSSLFAAQFALSHACWLTAYPLAGWSCSTLGLPAMAFLLGTLAIASLTVAWPVWPASDPDQVEHSHAELPDYHPHLKQGGRCHIHAFVIDDLHGSWPHGK